MPDPAPKKPNKRRSSRNSARGTTRLRVYRNAMGLGPNIASALLDLSETGLRVVSKEAVAVGQEVEVNLESASGRVTKTTAVVVWIVPATGDTFVVGLRLHKSLDYDQFMALTKP